MGIFLVIFLVALFGWQFWFMLIPIALWYHVWLPALEERWARESR